MQQRFCFIFLLPMALFSVTALYAQQGIPEPRPFTAQITSNYAQHEDFMPSLVRRLRVPPGFEVVVAASGLGKARMIKMSEQGFMYVTRRDVGDVLMLKDTNDDDKFDELSTVVANFRNVHGIDIHEGWLYLCSDTKLARGRLNEDGSVEVLDTLINDLPDGAQHNNRTIAFGPDGKLYISVGSDCNDCKETDPDYATLLQANEDGSNRKIFARNLRNTIGFDWHPLTGELWGMDHGSDYKGDTIPHEELNRIEDNGDYGWPLVWGKRKIDYTREDPPGTTKEAYALTTVPAIQTYPAHSAPMNLHFINHDIHRPGYRNDALVSWHGSWNRSKPEGFKVQRIRFTGGQPGSVDDFLWGFYNRQRNTRFGRPVGIEISDVGSVFISDDANGIIYCVRKPGHLRDSTYSKK